MLLPQRLAVRLSPLVLLAILSVQACAASTKREIGVPREHISNELFEALKANQNKVVQLWLRAREADGQQRKDLEARALKMQKNLANDVNDMKVRFKKVLDLTKQRYEAAVKEANPELTDKQRKALEAVIADTEIQLRSWKYSLEQFNRRYYREHAKTRREIEEAEEERVRIYEQCLDILKKEEDELRKAKERLKFLQKSQAYDSLDEMIEEEAREDKTTQERWKSMAEYFKGNESKAQFWVDHYTQSVNDMRQKVSSGDFRPHPMGYSVNEWRKGYIEPVQQGLADREKAFRNAELPWQHGAIRTINYLQQSLDAQNEKLKGKSATIQRLEEEMAYLQKMIDAKFIPEVPDPEGMLDHICDALVGLGQMVDDLGHAEKILNLIKMNNPWSILDYACEQAYGKPILALLAEKSGLDKYMTNKWVKMAIEGKLDINALRQEVANNVLPQEVVNTIEKLDRIRRDPKGLVREEVAGMVDANPYLKNTLQKAEMIHDFITEPQTVKDHLQQRFAEKVKDIAEGTDLYKQADDEYQRRRQKLREALEKQRQNAEAYTKGVATAVDRAVKESLINQYAPDLLEKAGKLKTAGENFIDSLDDAMP